MLVYKDHVLRCCGIGKFPLFYAFRGSTNTNLLVYLWRFAHPNPTHTTAVAYASQPPSSLNLDRCHHLRWNVTPGIFPPYYRPSRVRG